MKAVRYLVLGVVGMCAWLAGPVSGWAAPPNSPRGIGIATVLTLYDRARLVAFRLDRMRTHDPEGARTGSGDTLEALDTVVIDPGHGGRNVGAVGVTGVAEKFLTLELAYRLRARLQRAYPDLRVLLTRYWDSSVSVHRRTHLANQLGADLFLSLHYNAAPHPRALGVETYFLTTNETIPGRQQIEGEPVATLGQSTTGIDRPAADERVGVQGEELAIIKRDLRRARRHLASGRLAELTQNELISHLDAEDRGVKQANFGVLRGALMPSVVVEAGFLTHPKEGRRVAERPRVQHLCRALVDTVASYDDYATRRSGD